MDVPLEPSSGMLSLHLEAEGGTEGKSLFFLPSQATAARRAVMPRQFPTTTTMHMKKRRKTKNEEGLREQQRKPPKKKNKQRKSLKHAQVIAEDARPCLTSMLTKTLAKIVYCTKKHFGARPKARDVRKT